MAKKYQYHKGLVKFYAACNEICNDKGSHLHNMGSKESISWWDTADEFFKLERKHTGILIRMKEKQEQKEMKRRRLQRELENILEHAEEKHYYLVENGTKITEEEYKRLDREEFELYDQAKQIELKIKKLKN